MSDKQLSELEWKRFSKGRGFKDGPFVKALAALENARTPDAALQALDDIDKQAAALGKGQSSDKELTAYLGDVGKAVGRQRKASELEARQAAKQEADADEEEASPTMLSTQLVPLLRQVRKGDTLPVLLASNGKQVAVLLSRRAIAPTRRKLLTEFLGGGTAKFFSGTCVFEENAHTFVLKTQAAGLAKKVRAALLEQTGLRVKVRVRGEDPGDIDDDGEAAEGEEDTPQDSRAPGGPKDQAAAIPEPPPLPADGLKSRYDSRMAAMEPGILATLKAQAGDSSKIRAVAEFARAKAGAGDFKAALAGLDSLAKLLDAAGTVSPQSAPGQPPDAQATAFNARLAALLPRIKEAGGAPAAEARLKASEAGTFARKKDFGRATALLDEAEALLGTAPAGGGSAQQGAEAVPAAGLVRMQQSRLAWVRTRQAVKAQLDQLEQSILAEFKDAPDLGDIRQQLRRLDAVLTVLDDELVDVLDAALTAQAASERDRLRRQAREQVQAYRDYVAADSFVAALDGNPFTTVSIRDTVTRSLAVLDKSLA